MADANCKTIFVLDHSQYFSISSEDYIPLDYLKGKAPASCEISVSTSNSLLQFSKSLWTCAVESSIEYCRIVWDLFPREKLVRFIVSDTAAHIVNTWNSGTQNMSHVLNAMALVGIPQRVVQQSSDYSVIHGLRAAAEALAEPTESQEADVTANAKGESKPITNKGRVICITSARDNPSMKSLEDIFHTVLLQQNSISTTHNKLLSIDHCDFVIINVVPLNVDSLVTSRGKQEFPPILTTEIHTVCAPKISDKLTHLIMSHYDLASTTVTGIPMKEEQNANSSANYDVEILHARNAHTSICGKEVLLPTSTKEGTEYETVTLKWCTPRGCGSSEMQPCMAQHRVTPVDVTSRPSACLINFLLNGRSVLLEMPRKTGGKITSHLLSARSGEIYIHALQITRSILEDPWSISEGLGGRVTDYRVADFAAFIKTHRLVPLKTKIKPEENLHKARERINRRTHYFPLVSSNSIVYTLVRHLPWLPYLLHKVAKEDMDKTDEAQCLQYIFELYTSASRGEILPFPNMTPNRIKGYKKIEQYRLLCLELEALIKGHSTTPHHKVILESVQNVRTACSDYNAKSDSDSSHESNGNKTIRATTDSPLSPPHSMSPNDGNGNPAKSTKRKEKRTLLDIFISTELNQSSKRLDFSGRLCTPPGQIAALYPNFGSKEKEAGNSSAGAKEDPAGIKMDLSRA